jgi:hypothetical protein
VSFTENRFDHMGFQRFVKNNDFLRASVKFFLSSESRNEHPAVATGVSLPLVAKASRLSAFAVVILRRVLVDDDAS